MIFQEHSLHSFMSKHSIDDRIGRRMVVGLGFDGIVVVEQQLDGRRYGLLVLDGRRSRQEHGGLEIISKRFSFLINLRKMHLRI